MVPKIPVDLMMAISYHSQIVLDIYLDRESLPKPFRFIEMWTLDPRCEEVMRNAWNIITSGFESFKLCAKIQNTKLALKWWIMMVFGNYHLQLRNHEEPLSCFSLKWLLDKNKLGFSLNWIRLIAILRIYGVKSHNNWDFNREMRIPDSSMRLQSFADKGISLAITMKPYKNR